MDGLGPGGETRGRAPPPGRTPGGRPGGQGDVRTGLRPAGARAGQGLPAAGPRGRPGHLLAAAAAVLDLPVEPTEDLLESLVDTSLLESAAPGRYRYHDLVRLYARACAERDELPPEEREAAMSRLLDFYLATAARVYAIERPGDRTVDHLETTRHPGQEFTDDGTALDWLHAEAACILACVQQSLGAPTLRRAVDLLLAAKDLAESGASSLRYESATVAARNAAHTAGEARAEGRARVTLTQVLIASGRFEEASVEAATATALKEAADDPWLSANAPNEQGIIAICKNEHAEGEAYLLKAIEAFRDDGNRPGEASALCNLSRVLVSMGRAEAKLSNWSSKAWRSTTSWA